MLTLTAAVTSAATAPASTRDPRSGRMRAWVGLGWLGSGSGGRMRAMPHSAHASMCGAGQG
eukprot:scaffold4489_cov30-Phaeocystis_antarctica.AAC.2